ncbi:MAG: glycine--tRNA ligase [Candidatus Chisholmbacteria bacterium RIFCSPHIGHO2_12_FULL_49_9]|uniref:glycine--tRNA ligase n=1 Tax=Candidatus Chisholmbacteria bacterium RIFCSPHIGHO2_01_FULL_52_32 TaxID=1797591 RepID=A0A1G1VTC5_9BACT|nr:MAG: glycine--tRNA ligase [Candidatus Chisholmbacteria bacterium RIFCSPHIGHO2_01_FULL_52_32]OGY20171.1 MAG: glycine--tRNA ligase [Candidatus Chisholmbacteria bacterium RIFCSPLOWO2_01_FULL_50_28]OGY20747.1 MAG: glycine--tRNA ligase [Candidatus Chisholmbacteria bacterium RIFCSPHIGHO2_12_FULL_49_9]
MHMQNLMDGLTALAKRRGFIFQGSEIYGGFAGFWDYGPLGVELKNNIKKEWWKSIVYSREDVVGLDAAIIMNPIVWEKSGHLKAFTDPLVECKHCHKRYRADQFKEASDELEKKLTGHRVSGGSSSKNLAEILVCDVAGTHTWKDVTQPKTFNLLTEVYLGTTEPKQKAYLRGEITQGVFVNFKNVVDSTRVKIPFGIAQIGKAFRNEITAGNFTFRSREFEQMELEYFVKPDAKQADRLFEMWKKTRLDWYMSLGMQKVNLRFRQHEDKERAHYAVNAEDIEYKAPFGWSEFEGIHNRTDYDLKSHGLSYKDEDGSEYFPWVIETSGGVDRTALFFLIDAYIEDGKRTVLKLHPRLAPYKAAVFPLLSNKPELVSKAREIYATLCSRFYCAWDDRGNIGKRYFAQDEIGTPWCVTVDFDTLKDNTVTVRDRDTTKQERQPIDSLLPLFLERLNA